MGRQPNSIKCIQRQQNASERRLLVECHMHAKSVTQTFWEHAYARIYFFLMIFNIFRLFQNREHIIIFVNLIFMEQRNRHANYNDYIMQQGRAQVILQGQKYRFYTAKH